MLLEIILKTSENYTRWFVLLVKKYEFEEPNPHRMKYAKSIEEYFGNQDLWEKEMQFLRSILLETELQETLKWGIPVYVWKNENIAGIGAFKKYFGIWFYQGALLSDPHKLLINAQKGKTVAMRQMRFNRLEEVDPAIIRNYLDEAIENQKKGLEIKPQRKKPLVLPDILTQTMKDNQDFKRKFEAMSLSNRREFAEYLTEPKRETTKLRRLEKVISLVLVDKGLNDQYKR